MSKRFFFHVGTATLAMTCLIGSALAQPAPFAPNPFTDVPKTSVNFDAIEYLRLNNILRGYLDGTFKPTTRINRAEFVHLVTNPFFLSGERITDCIKTTFSPNIPDTIYFSDVKSDVWYADEVCLATLKHLVDGYPDGTFKPGRNIIFVEAAKVILNTFSIDFKNEPTGEFWYDQYVRKLAELKAIPTTIHRFDQLLTRGEMAEILFRIKTQNTAKASMQYGDLKR